MQLAIPEKYCRVLDSLSTQEISFGVGGLRLFRRDEIEKGHVGYSVARDGARLLGAKDGVWQPTWIVIGLDTAYGDPVILDASNPALPVFSDFNGQGRWDPRSVSLSIESFVASLNESA